MDIRLQAKLLRAIQEKEIDRVGGSSPVKVDLRVIATSNRDLQQEIKKGNFREDLYFRLNIINIELPSLKERGKDIELLGEYFIKKYVQNNGLGTKKLSELALEKMLAYPWPGNVRELENVLHRAVLVSETNEIMPDDIAIKEKIPTELEFNSQSQGPGGHEKQMLFNTLGYCLGDLHKAANILGISIEILREKVKAYTKT
ncbi:MAG: hypothetical protein Tsb006_1310 [Rickettsiaceae bacterium]